MEGKGCSVASESRSEKTRQVPAVFLGTLAQNPGALPQNLASMLRETQVHGTVITWSPSPNLS